MRRRPKITIIAAAIHQGGLTYSVPRPSRHHDIIRLMAASGLPTPIQGQQGFLGSDGNFYSRGDAEYLAGEAKQLTKPLIGSILTSEDLW